MFSQEDVCCLCKPLFMQTPITTFSYSKLYKDNSRSEVWSNFEAMNHTFNIAKYIVGHQTPKFFETEKVEYMLFFLSEKVKEYPKPVRIAYQRQLLDMRNIFGLDNGLVFLKKNDLFSEFFIFYGAIGNSSIINFYLNHIDFLKNFNSSFVKNGEKLISQADEKKIVSANQTTIKLKSIITKREAEVAKLLQFGLSATEISEKLYISPRTVEHHVINMKIKLNCSKKSELLNLLFDVPEIATLIE